MATITISAEQVDAALSTIRRPEQQERQRPTLPTPTALDGLRYSKFVCFLFSEATGLVKISESLSVGGNTPSLKSGSAGHLHVLGGCSSRILGITKDGLHKTFAAFRVAGEWFRPERSLVDFLDQRFGSLDVLPFRAHVEGTPLAGLVDFDSSHTGETKAAEAARFLVSCLKDGPRGAGLLQREAKRLGIAAHTLWRASKSLGVSRQRVGGPYGQWMWELPSVTSAPPEPQAPPPGERLVVWGDEDPEDDQEDLGSTSGGDDDDDEGLRYVSSEETEETAAWLAEVLADGPMPAPEVCEKARLVGIDGEALFYGSLFLGVVFGDGGTWGLAAR